MTQHGLTDDIPKRSSVVFQDPDEGIYPNTKKEGVFFLWSAHSLIRPIGIGVRRGRDVVAIWVEPVGGDVNVELLVGRGCDVTSMFSEIGVKFKQLSHHVAEVVVDDIKVVVEFDETRHLTKDQIRELQTDVSFECAVIEFEWYGSLIHTVTDPSIDSTWDQRVVADVKHAIQLAKQIKELSEALNQLRVGVYAQKERAIANLIEHREEESCDAKI